MAEQIVINIVRPEVGIEYRAESPEAEIRDRLAASELGLHALARHVRELRDLCGLDCPDAVKYLAESESWRDGL